MSDDCCSAKETELRTLGTHDGLRGVLLVVLAINLLMFVAELSAGLTAHSTSLVADSADMLGDSLVYVLSLFALDRGARWRAGAALVKGILIAVFGVGVAIEAMTKVLRGVAPIATTMLVFGSIALVANLSCLALLYQHRRRDVNMASTFACSRNDVIANIGVLLAAGGVRWFGAGWPDILVGSIIAVVLCRSALSVIRSARTELRSQQPSVHADGTAM